MINRVLIRIKVVQLLYSYFLVQNNFSVQSQPQAPTKEKRFAYTLYLDYLYLMMQIADAVRQRGSYSPLSETRFIKRLASDNIMKSVIGKYASSVFQLVQSVDTIAEAVKNSTVYKHFLKDTDSDALLWNKIFKDFIANDPNIASVAVNYENYSMRGVDRAKQMIADTFTEFSSSQDNITDCLKDLADSLDKARELYFRLLLLPVEITYQQEVELDEKRHRYLKTEEDMNPNPKFIDNELVKLLADSEEIREYAERKKISWVEQDRELVKHLLNVIRTSDLYRSYMEEPVADLHEDCEFWRKVMKNIIFEDQEFLETLETMSVFWNDDIDIIGAFVLKTIRRFEEYGSAEKPEASPILPMYKDEEDAAFGRELFEFTVRNRTRYRKYIDEALNRQHWESDRLAYMDVVIMQTALAEILNFPGIPLQASFNEYIEMAKCYSTAKSGAFVNGLLASVIANLKENGILRK